MRKYNERQELEKVLCNQCKKELRVENGIVKEGCFSVQYSFDYFSQKDGEKHKFDICECCYDQWTKQFFLPPEKCEENELL